MTDHQYQSGAARGFSGLSSLASSISSAPTVKPPTPVQANDPLIRAERIPKPNSSEFKDPFYWISGVKWAAVIVAGIGLFAYLNTQPVTESLPVAVMTPSAPVSRPSTPPPPVTQPPPARSISEPQMVPPAAAGQTLSQGQIKYCLAEKIRIDAMEGMINQSRQAHIKNFNIRVDDYNARCRSYRYWQADMNLAQTEIEAIRNILRSQASDLVQNWR